MRYKRIVLDAPEGIVFEISERRDEELFIRALRDVYSKLPTVSAGEYAEALSVYTDDDGNKAIVPRGWTVSGVRKENTIWGKDMGLVIYHITEEKVSGINWEDQEKVEFLMRTHDQMVWVPVSLLTANGTLDGIHFNKKFGRRNYRNDKFSDDEFNEALNYEQLESVETYGGFYISRYNISMGSGGKPQSVKGVMQWLTTDFDTAKTVASTIEDNEAVKSHLTFGAEYDSVLEWFINSGTKTPDEIAKDSTKWGNYWNTENSPETVVETGSRKEGCANNIYGFAGNVREWTQERNGSHKIFRGGTFGNDGNKCPVAYRHYNYSSCSSSCVNTGFRATLCIK